MLLVNNIKDNTLIDNMHECFQNIIPLKPKTTKNPKGVVSHNYDQFLIWCFTVVPELGESTVVNLSAFFVGHYYCTQASRWAYSFSPTYHECANKVWFHNINLIGVTRLVVILLVVISMLKLDSVNPLAGFFQLPSYSMLNLSLFPFRSHTTNNILPMSAKSTHTLNADARKVPSSTKWCSLVCSICWRSTSRVNLWNEHRYNEKMILRF